MRKFPALALVSVMAAIVFVYWLGSMPRDVYGPYEDTQQLLPVHDVDIVVQAERDPVRVFLSISGVMTDWCGVPGDPVISQVGEVYQVEVPIVAPEPCDGRQPFEKRFELGPITPGEMREQLVDVNGYPTSFEIDPDLNFQSFSYGEATFKEYPALFEAEEKAELVISIDSLATSSAGWIRDAYERATINFAGHFVVLEGECEADVVVERPCLWYVVVDAVTGRTVQSLQYEGYPAGFRRESRLFVVNDPLLTESNSPDEVKFLVLTDTDLPSFSEIATGAMNQYDRGSELTNI